MIRVHSKVSAQQHMLEMLQTINNSEHFMVRGTISLLGIIQFVAIIGNWTVTIGFLYKQDSPQSNTQSISIDL